MVVGTVNGKTYAFIAVERIGGIMVYDITDPRSASYVNYINSREFDADIKGDVSPEGLCLVPTGKSGNPILLAACEVSGTLAAYELKAKASSTEVIGGNPSGIITDNSSPVQNPTQKPEQSTEDKKENEKPDDKKEEKPEEQPKKETETVKPAPEGKVLKDTKTDSKYKVVSSDSKQPKVKYQGTTDKQKKTIAIPNTVKVSNVTYKVTIIEKNAFKNMKIQGV